MIQFEQKLLLDKNVILLITNRIATGFPLFTLLDPYL